MAQFQKDISTGGKSYYGTQLSNLQYNASIGNSYGLRQSPYFLGYEYGLGSIIQSWLEFNVYIPDNFVITEARITFIHTPVHWDNGGDYDVWGYNRNMKTYNVTNVNDVNVTAAFNSEYDVAGSYTLSEILNTFGEGGYTFPVSSATAYETTTITSKNIQENLTTGNNKIIIKSADTTPTYTGDLAVDGTNMGARTSFANAQINVFGYQN
jgi:hypothetical protein